MDARRIALIKPSALGDIVHALPVLTALRGALPGRADHVGLNSAYEPLIRNHPDLTDTLRVRSRRVQERRLASRSRYAMSLRRRIAPPAVRPRHRPARTLPHRADVPGDGGTAARRLRECPRGEPVRYTHKVRVPDADRIHAVDRYWRVAEALGAGDVPKRFHVPLDSGEVERGAGGVGRPAAAVGRGGGRVRSGSRSAGRRAHFAELLKRVQSHFGGTCLFVGTGEDTCCHWKRCGSWVALKTPPLAPST